MKSKHVPPPPPAIQRLRIAEGDPIAEGENPHTYMGAEAKTHSKLTQNGKSTGQRRKLTQNSLKTGNPQSAKNRKYKNIKK